MKTDSDGAIRLRNSEGADEANVGGHSYPRRQDGTFHVQRDAALWLLSTPSGFYRAGEPQPSEITTMTTRDFLALTPAGNPHPGAQFEVGGPGGRYSADLSGIIHDVAPNHSVALLSSGAIPLPPIGWTDPRTVAE